MYFSPSFIQTHSLVGGTITINSTNPLDAPLIDPNLFGTAFEFAAMRHGLRTALQFVEDSTMAESGFLQELLTPVSLASDDAALDAYIREAGATAVHPVGTCAMTAKDAGWGVVDPDLRVKGVDGLRIIDASVMVRSKFFEQLNTQDTGYSPSYRRHIQWLQHTSLQRGRRILSRNNGQSNIITLSDECVYCSVYKPHVEWRIKHARFLLPQTTFSILSAIHVGRAQALRGG